MIFGRYDRRLLLFVAGFAVLVALIYGAVSLVVAAGTGQQIIAHLATGLLVGVVVSLLLAVSAVRAESTIVLQEIVSTVILVAVTRAREAGVDLAEGGDIEPLKREALRFARAGLRRRYFYTLDLELEFADVDDEVRA